MEGTTEKDCSPLWSLYQQIVSDMKNSAPMWEEFISKATKLHSALKSALVAIAAFLDAFQKIADAATKARGATKEIGTALTRVCLRHRAIETRMKTFIGTLLDSLISPLSERAEEWRRAGAGGAGPLSREHARECRRARAELRRRASEHARAERRARPRPDKRRPDVTLQELQERRQQLEELEERAVKAALVEERSRFCCFVTLLGGVVESEVAMLAEVGHLQEGSEQLARHIAEPRTLPPASLQVVCDTKSSTLPWERASSPAASPLTRRSSMTSISSGNSQCSEQHVSGSTVSCSTPISNASSSGTIPAPNHDNSLSQCIGRLASVCSSDSGFRSQDALLRRDLYIHHGSDNVSVSSESVPALTADDELMDNSSAAGMGSSGSSGSTWPELKDTAQFERAASAIWGGRARSLSAALSRGITRPALSVHTYCEQSSRPPLPTRCSSLERPALPAPPEHKLKPSSLPPHLTKEVPAALYVNMSELASLAAARAPQAAPPPPPPTEHPAQEKVCSESSASESSLESSSGYGSQGAFANDDHHHLQTHDECEIVIRRDVIVSTRDSFSISLGSLEEAVRSLDEASETPAFATIGKKPAVPKRRPVSMTASVWSRRGSVSSLGKPPPPARRNSSISRPQRPQQYQSPPSGPQSPPQPWEGELPPPPAFLLQPEAEHTDNAVHQNSVAETVKQLTELKHMPASPGLLRRSLQQLSNKPHPPTPSPLTSFQQAKTTFSESTCLNNTGKVNTCPNSTGNVNPIYGHTGHRIMAFENSVYVRKNSLNNSSHDLYADGGTYVSQYSPANSEHSLGSFGPRTGDSHYGHTGFKMAERRVSAVNSPRSHSADRHSEQLPGVLGSPRASRRQPPHSPGPLPLSAPAGFLDKLSATLQLQRRHLPPPTRGRAPLPHQPDPRSCHTSLMEQIKRGATLRRTKQCNDRSAPNIR